MISDRKQRKLEASRRFRHKHPDRAKQIARNYYLRHKSERDAYTFRWRFLNPNRGKETARRFYWNHTDQCRISAKVCRDNLTDGYIAALVRAKMLRRGLGGEPIPKELLEFQRKRLQLLRAIRCLTKSNP